MKKILFLFHPLKEAFQYLEKEGNAQYPPHHMWIFDKLEENGYQVDFVRSDDQTWINKFGNKLRLNFLQQQIDTLKVAKDYDLVFLPYVDFSFFLSICKLLNIFQKPIVGLAHRPYYQERKNPIKRTYYNLVRYVYFKGLDSILFYSKPILDKSNLGKVKGNCKYIENYGIDFDFIDSYAKSQTSPPQNNYIFSTGGSQRDYDTLITAFHELDFDLKITTVGGDLSTHMSCELSPNVHIDNSLSFGLGSPGLIRKEYYNALAVAVPLKKVDDYKFGTWGITVILEGMAMGKPVLSTYNDAYPFDIEKEKVGFYVDYGDVKGWRDAVKYLIDNPGEVFEMGERARYLSKTKYNYAKFAQNVISEIDSTILHRRPNKQVLKTSGLVNL